jgi:hypothetical protein
MRTASWRSNTCADRWPKPLRLGGASAADQSNSLGRRHTRGTGTPQPHGRAADHPSASPSGRHAENSPPNPAVRPRNPPERRHTGEPATPQPPGDPPTSPGRRHAGKPGQRGPGGQAAQSGSAIGQRDRATRPCPAAQPPVPHDAAATREPGLAERTTRRELIAQTRPTGPRDSRPEPATPQSPGDSPASLGRRHPKPTTPQPRGGSPVSPERRHAGEAGQRSRAARSGSTAAKFLPAAVPPGVARRGGDPRTRLAETTTRRCMPAYGSSAGVSSARRGRLSACRPLWEAACRRVVAPARRAGRLAGRLGRRHRVDGADNRPPLRRTR